MMPHLKKALGGALFALLSLGFSTSHADPLTLRVGYGSAAEEPLWVMKASPEVTPNQGKAYKLDYTFFRGTDKRFQALEAGDLDIATGSTHSVMMAAAHGLKFKVVASLSREGGNGFATQYMALDTSPIKTIKDLKGKTIGINGARSSAEIWARLALTKNGLDPARDVKWVAIPFPSQGEAVRAGQLDVGAFPQPFAAFEEKRGGMHTVFTSTDGTGHEEDLMLLLASEKMVKEHPDVLRAFLADLVKAAHFYAREPRKSGQELIAAKFVNIPLDTFVNMRKNGLPLDGKVNMDAMHSLVDDLTKFGYIDTKLDLKQVIDMSYLPG